MSDTTYTQCYSNFTGVDMSSDPRAVSRSRLAYSVNMWRDYESEQGAAIETFPGFRRIQAMRNSEEDIYPICGLWHYKGSKKEYVIFQKYNTLYACKTTELEETPTELYTGINPNGATCFTINNNLYLVSSQNGTGYSAHLVVINEDASDNITAQRIEEYYVPTTYYNGKPYEQRNGLGNMAYQVNTDGGVEDSENSLYVNVPIYEHVNVSSNGTGNIASVTVNGKNFSLIDCEEDYGENNYKIIKQVITVIKDDDKYAEIVLQFQKDDIYDDVSKLNKEVKIKYEAYATHFNTVGNLKVFQNDKKITMAEAVLGCTKSAVYDGRVFLTGNPSLPNTVFYSQRNLTGANDPTYFGVYNYFNDGDGNTPNVDLLAMPAMLMVIKGDTVQDGSIYYHVGADNTDDETKDLVPRLYPSTKGAAGLGSAGDTTSHSLSCNFLDDPVFLSKRGLEAVGKENVSLERTLVHRSSNVDRMLLREDLAHASLTEWKGYLVICCNGHIYLADSRRLSQHPDGSYQYEWFYLEGVGTYDKYNDVYLKVTEWPQINGVSLKDIVERDNNEYKLWESKGKISDVKDEDGFYHIFSQTIDSITVYYYLNYSDMSRWIVDVAYGEKLGTGEFYGARRVLSVGDLLIFATDYEICVFNTDKRGKDILDENGDLIRSVDDDKIDSSYYTFGGVRYLSACATKLDDCDKKSVTKNTLYGTTAARFKMMPGSHCGIRLSTNGRDWEDIGEAFSSRTDIADMDFGNFAFAEDEDNVVVLPEVSRGWGNKQYYFYSDGFCEPFGLYELSYIYKIAGKIRYL